MELFQSPGRTTSQLPFLDVMTATAVHAGDQQVEDYRIAVKTVKQKMAVLSPTRHTRGSTFANMATANEIPESLNAISRLYVLQLKVATLVVEVVSLHVVFVHIVLLEQ